MMIYIDLHLREIEPY